MFFMEEIRHPMQGREFKLKRTKFKVGGISTPPQKIPTPILLEFVTTHPYN